MNTGSRVRACIAVCVTVNFTFCMCVRTELPHTALFRFDISVGVCRFLLVGFGAKPIAKGLDAFAELTGDPADATGSKKKQDDNKNDDPFRTTW